LIVHGLYQGTVSSPYGNFNINSSMEFSGAAIRTDTILLSSQFGLFPFAGPHQILADSNWLTNHRAKAETDALSAAGSNRFAGLVLVDYSGLWHAHFDWSEYSSEQGYFYEDGFDSAIACSDGNLFDESDTDYREDFYNYFYCNNPTQIQGLYDSQQIGEGENLDALMRQQWNETARAFFEETIAAIRTVLPRAKIGFLDYPTSIYKSERLATASPNVFGYGNGKGLGSIINDELSWLYEQIDILSPHLEAVRYSVDNNKTPQIGIENTKSQNKSYLENNLAEMKRISTRFGTSSAPVVPHFYNINKKIPYHETLLSSTNENQQIYLANQSEPEYLVVFSYVTSEENKQEIEALYVPDAAGLSSQSYGFNTLARPVIDSAVRLGLVSSFLDPPISVVIEPDPETLGENNDPPIMGIFRQSVRVYPLWEDRFVTLSGHTNEFVDWWKVPEGVDNLIARLDNDFGDGFRRFMLYLPGGGLSNSTTQSPNQWFTMSEERQEEIESKLGAWIEANESAQVMLFLGLKIELNLDKIFTHEIDFDNTVVPDIINDSLAAEYVRQNLDPWVNIGVTNFVFPMAFDEDTEEEFRDFAFANWIFDRRVTGIGLPIDSDGLLIEESLSNFPIAERIEEYLQARGDNDWVFSSENTEVGVFVSPAYEFSANELTSLLDDGVIFYTTEGWQNALLGIDDSALETEISTAVAPIFEIDNEAGTDPIEGFGLVRYNPGTATAVGETDGEIYQDRELTAIANSLDGTFEINTELNKYTVVTVDILNPSFVNTSYPHYVIEDSFEWVNSGMPSHLSQVMHSNMATMGVNLTRTNAGDMEKVPPYQARYIVPCNRSFYDSFNSTVDFELESDVGARKIFIPYTNATAYIAELNAVWVGGVGGVISIDTDSKQINEVIIDSRRSLSIQDIFVLNDFVYIVDQTAIYIYSLVDGSIERDPALGVETNIRRFVKTRGDAFIIGAEDGFYARKSTQDEYKKVLDTDNPVDRIIHPDATIAIAGPAVYYTTDGFTWSLVGTASQEISDITKYRNKIMFATDEGLYDDNGNVYAGRLSLRLNDIFNDLDDSREAIVNAVDGTVLKVLAGLNDGRYIVLDDFGFAVGEIDGINAIHSVLIVDGENWIFGYDKFAITSEGTVRLLATGTTLTDDLNGIGQII